MAQEAILRGSLQTQGSVRLLDANQYRRWVDNLTAPLFKSMNTSLSDNAIAQHAHGSGKLAALRKANPKNYGLDLFWRHRWQESPFPGAFFISVPWHDLFECIGSCSWSVPKKMAALGKIWNEKLDWSRPHFIALNQVYPSMVFQQSEGRVNLSRPKLRIFDSRLEAFEDLVCRFSPGYKGHSSVPRLPLPRIPIPLFHWPPTQDHAASQRCEGAARTLQLAFRGTCDNGDRSHRAQIVQHLVQQNLPGRDLNCTRARLGTFTRLLCSAEWTLTPSGTCAPTFMIYEALHFGSLPMYVYKASALMSRRLHWNCNPRSHGNRLPAEKLDTVLPFHDEGVRFSSFGKVVIVPQPEGKASQAREHEAFSQAMEEVATFTKISNYSQRRVVLDAVKHYFTPNGTWSYMLRHIRRWQADERLAIAAGGDASSALNMTNITTLFNVTGSTLMRQSAFEEP